ncbi:MAG: ABC transporter ATP-binding protein [Candidatus Sumerlaeota bacterium]|nr:ABC transporter ATP-binding protein [Candidatus Sumerlaeota bacterium]
MGSSDHHSALVIPHSTFRIWLSAIGYGDQDMRSVRLDNVSKRFGDVVALEGVSLAIERGEFFSLLGGSGCGKTTTLRLVAGFEAPSAGEIFFDDRPMSAVPANRRNTAMVFQNYALFPHLHVFGNVAFGLKARGVPAKEIAGRVREALALVDLEGFETRDVHELSGGQQQRVAVARAAVVRPDILLLDEPLSNLDARLRKSTRAGLLRVQRSLGATTIYVTHDQDEALALSDRIAVMRDGRIEQVGTPRELYENPGTPFVARFIGETNLLRGRWREKEGTWTVDLRGAAGIDATPAMLDRFARSAGKPQPGGDVLVGIKPEGFRLAALGEEAAWELVVESCEYRGTATAVHGRLAAGSCVASLPSGQLPAQLPRTLRVALNAAATNVSLFPPPDSQYAESPRQAPAGEIALDRRTD